MLNVKGFEIIVSEFPNENGEYYYTISDGVRTKGEFPSRQKAADNMERIILNWMQDS